jgi:hypothetical protein
MRNNIGGPAFCALAAAEHAAPLRNNAAIGPFSLMVSISITQAAYDAIRSTFLDLPGDAPGPDGTIKIWLDPKFADGLAAMRGPGEGYSEVILRLAEAI